MSRVDEMRELTGRLAVNHADRRQALGNLSREVNRQQADAAMAHAAMATEQRATLAADQANRRQAVDAMLAGLDAEHAAMATELRAFLQEDHETRSAAVASERTDLRHSLTEMAQVWHGFAAAPWGAPPPAESPAPPPPPAESPAPPPPVAPQAAEAEDAAQKVMHYLNEHPEGAKLMDLEPQMDLARPQLGRLLRQLVDGGKLVKDPETLVYKLA